MLRNISITVAVAACLLVEYLRGVYQGFAYGTSHLCDVRYPVTEGGFWSSHMDPYFFIIRYLSPLFFALLIFIVAKFIEKETLSQFASFLPLILCVLFGFGVNGEINLVIRDPHPYINLLRETVYEHWAVYAAVSILLLLQAATVSQSLYKKRKATLK